MVDKIHLLPDSLANQIAAGEVIQRPSSAVKELLENAVDAGATKVQLYIKDAGKQLIQVIDNGSGMSETDARMAFERHATSKIKSISDLFALNSMGFRGEALASMASIAQIEIRTKLPSETLGVKLQIENSQMVYKSLEAVPEGTNIQVKNLFFNVPARRKFLKSNTTELRHITDEFIRVAMAFPEVHFQLYNEGKIFHNLEPGNEKSRIVNILGNSWNSRLVPVMEKTDYLIISGFVGKPETANKSRLHQYFIVNHRFVKNHYFHHAIQRAFEGLIAGDEHPAYVLYIDIDPSKLDINVHPTKQEVKFEDERLIYSFLNASVKHALGRYSISPSLDFTLDSTMTKLNALNMPFTEEQKEKNKDGFLFNAFKQSGQAHKLEQKNALSQWKTAMDFDVPKNIITPSFPEQQFLTSDFDVEQETHKTNFSSTNIFQWNDSIIVTSLKSGIVLIKQHEAHLRILYDDLKNTLSHDVISSQNLIMPIKIELGLSETQILMGLVDELNLYGFDISHFGHHEFVIHAIPCIVPPTMVEETIKQILSDFEINEQIKIESQDKFIYNLAKSASIKSNQKLSLADMENIVSKLFSTSMPSHTPKGDKIFSLIQEDTLKNLFV